MIADLQGGRQIESSDKSPVRVEDPPNVLQLESSICRILLHSVAGIVSCGSCRNVSRHFVAVRVKLLDRSVIQLVRRAYVEIHRPHAHNWGMAALGTTVLLILVSR